MICPYCGIGVNIDWDSNVYETQNKEDFRHKCLKTLAGFCPECNGFIAKVQEGFWDRNNLIFIDIIADQLVYPKFSSNRVLSASIPEPYRKNFQEEEQVLPISPKASATISRYLLQLIFHSELDIKGKNLAEEIDTFAKNPIYHRNL
jgi:hypothetical protein